MNSLTVEVNLDELSLPSSPMDNFINENRVGNYDIAETVNDIITTIETHVEREVALSEQKATAEEMKESWGLGWEEPGRWLSNDDLEHRLIIPTIGPAKPRRIRME